MNMTSISAELVNFASPREERVYLGSSEKSLSHHRGEFSPLPPPPQSNETTRTISKGVSMETEQSAGVTASGEAKKTDASIFMATNPEDEDLRNFSNHFSQDFTLVEEEEDSPIFSARKKVEFSEASNLDIFLDEEERKKRARTARSESTVSTVSETESLQLQDAIEQLEKPAKILANFEDLDPFQRPLSSLEDPEIDPSDVDNEEIFPENIFQPSSESCTSTESNTTTIRFSCDRQKPEKIAEILGNPHKVATTDFSELISTLTSTLAVTNVYDPQKNPFHPFYKMASTVKTPANPFECSNFRTENGIFIPPLDFQQLREKPTEILSGLSVQNPFRLEAWAESVIESVPKKHAQTARYPLTYEESEDESDAEAGNQNQDNEDHSKNHISRQNPASYSAPCTVRRPAPCAVVYPSTSNFIQMVHRLGIGLGGEETKPANYFYDGCCTDDETALHCAAARGHLECVQSLLETGAPVDAQDQTGQTALHLALRRSHIDIALLLITKGCSLDIQDENGDTPLHIASRLGLASAVQTLCHLGASVDVINAQSLTPLHLAAKEGHIEIVRCLCLAGANVHIKNKDGFTAEIIALAQENAQIGSLLSKMKSDQTRDLYIEQLCPLDSPLRRIKLKLFGHSETGKTRLIHALQATGMIGSIIDAVSRRFSDNSQTIANSSVSSISDEGIHSCASSSSTDSNNLGGTHEKRPFYPQPTHSNYTKGIDVQNITLSGSGEFSVWEFGGYEPYHIAYDHFVGNTDCVHVVMIRGCDPTEIQYKQVLYWMNFLKGRVTPSEPIGHCGIVSRRSKVIVVGTHATQLHFPEKNSDGEYTSSDAEAMMQTIKVRFETHFDIHDRLILLDSTNPSCPGLKSLKNYLNRSRDQILIRLQKPLVLLDSCVNFLATLRKRYANFPVITWPHFTNVIRTDVNPLASDSHCRQLIQQLQLIGEVVYLRDEASELDYVVLTPEWLGTHVIGILLSAEFLSHCRTGCYTIDDFGPVFPEIPEPGDLLHILNTLQLCAPIEAGNDSEFEFPAFVLMDPPKDVWIKNRPNYVYGGLRILPMRGMERSLQSTFPRIQVAMRRSMHDFHDPMDADLTQWQGCSKMCSGQMEALVRLHGDAVEVQHCLKNFEKDLAEIRKKDLRESCERVKSDLSYFSDTKIIIEGEPRNDIDRNLFDGICKNIIDEICDHMRSITGEMKTREIEIHDVLLVGGSTRLHFIREIIDSALKPAQKSEYRYDTVVIAEEAIALGCAIHGSEPSIEKNGTDMEPTDQDVPNNTGVAPTAQETPNDTGVTPTVQDTPNDTGINSKVKKDNRETDEKQKCENDYPQSNTNPTDQVNAKLIETLPNNQPEDEFRDTSSNDVGIDLVSENPDSIRTSDDNSMNNLTPKAKKDGTKTSKVKESAKKDLHNAIHKKSGTEANKTNDQEDKNTDINSSTKLNATNNDSKQNKKVASDLIKQVSQPNNTTNDRTNHRKVFKQSSTSAHHNNQTHHDHRIEIPQPVTSFRKDRKNTANSKSANLGGNGPSMPVAHQKDIKSERPMHKDHRTETHHSTPSQQIHLNSTSSILDHQNIQSYEVNQNSTSFSKQITENRQILKEQSKKTKSADEILALKVQQSYMKNPNSPVQPPYMNKDEKTKPGNPTVIGNFVKDPSKQAASTKNLVKSSPNPAASSTSYGPQNREPLRDSFKDKVNIFF
uniref:Non-specific serine/threonine protein kinase n=1 Tax=Acrobeloides nanus TaxID=290746 RepID=A0A914CMF3_9BILA